MIFEGPEGTAHIPTSVSDWELYSGMKGADLVAANLTKALKKAIWAPKRSEAIRIMSEALSKYDEFGACDTEPRAIAESCLTAARGGDYAWTL